jgi:pyruvate,water dikinase
MIAPQHPVLPPGGITPDRSGWGGKGQALVRLREAGLPVPAVVALTPDAFHNSLGDEARAAIAAASRGALAPDNLGGALETLAASDEVRGVIEQGLRTLGQPDYVAVRSSAPDEDGVAHAFAGQLESFLFVPATIDAVARRVADVWRSAFAPRVWAYRASKGLHGPPQPPAVLLQVMLGAESAGVSFGADPVTGARDHVVVSAVRGLASALVDGRADAETIRVNREGRVVQRDIGRQTVVDRFDTIRGEGVREVTVPAIARVLTDGEIARVAALTRRASEIAGSPQDVEWAFADGALWLLQSRPITALPDAPAAPVEEGRLRLWDNSNIVESYGGVTTPLTYSFARRAYEVVYRSFCRLLRVPEHRIEAEAETFAQMIGLVRGRVYYNLGSWYRVLALLPGYRTNASLMEGMMGVREPIPDALRPAPASIGRLRDVLGLAGSVWGLVVAHWTLGRRKRAFYARLNAALALPPGGLVSLSLDALVETYQRLESQLLTRWDAPLVNDFFAMIWFGLANRAADQWIGPNALGNLLTGDGEVISAEPARRVRTLAATLRDDAPMADLLLGGTANEIAGALADRPALAAALADYLARFGDRCLDELKLESPTLDDDPMPLYRSVGAMAERLRTADVPPPGQVEAALRAEADERMRAALRGHPLRRVAFGWLLRNARERVRDRENLRFERTRVFGRARRLVLLMGARLAAAGRLRTARDVFYLDLTELLGASTGTSSSQDLAGLAAVRRAEFTTYRNAAPPPDRFLTAGSVLVSDLADPSRLHGGVSAAPPAVSATGGLSGLGCCPGVVEGPVRVVRDPRGVTLEPGTILVAERTDPGWILLFPACRGLIVERGSLLSHSAIVARELGIPAVVSVPGVTSILQDGDIVRLDGATGVIERLGDA